MIESTDVTTEEKFTATERLWLTADRERVVRDGDPSAAFLFATPGKAISTEDVERYGLTKSRRTAPENKAVAQSENKGDAGEAAGDAGEAPPAPPKRPARRKSK